jgi:abhydrolase domain-containing protein 12
MLSSFDSEHTFALAFDYRGFGRTQGSPTEAGILDDAIAVVKWALDTAKVPSNRIVFVSQSLGTAIASAVASHFIDQTPKIEFAGIVLCAPFVDAPTAFQNYSIGGVIPLLAPLRVLSPLRNWFIRQFPDPWKTNERTRNLVRKSDRLRLTFVHATNDMTIPPSQTDELFYQAAEATRDGDLTRQEIDQNREEFDLGEGGWTHLWTSGDKIIRKDILRYGGMFIALLSRSHLALLIRVKGHNTIMKWAPVSLAVARTFDFEKWTDVSRKIPMPPQSICSKPPVWWKKVDEY